jgi:hypothetical protein
MYVLAKYLQIYPLEMMSREQSSVPLGRQYSPQSAPVARSLAMYSNPLTGPISTSCNIRCFFFENVYSQTSFYIIVNQVVCVFAKCTCLAHSMLHLAEFISDIHKCSTRERVRLARH